MKSIITILWNKIFKKLKLKRPSTRKTINKKKMDILFVKVKTDDSKGKRKKRKNNNFFHKLNLK